MLKNLKIFPVKKTYTRIHPIYQYPELGEKFTDYTCKNLKMIQYTTEKCYFEYEFIALSGNPNIGTVINYVSIVTHTYESCDAGLSFRL